MNNTTDHTTIGALQTGARRQFAEAGLATPALDADLLLAAAVQTRRETLIAYPEHLVSAAQQAFFHTMVSRRLAHEPVSRILGRREFWGLPFEITTHTLDPRPDSETLVGAALRAIEGIDSPVVLDLGTGSGCLLLAILHDRQDALGVGVDRDPNAAVVAARNAAALDLAGRAHIMAGSWGDALHPRLFDLVISNPPYIATDEIAGLSAGVARYDPLMALDGGPDGLAAYREITPLLPSLVRSGGMAVLEVGVGQAGAVSILMERHGGKGIQIHQDLAGYARCVSAVFAENREKS